METENRPDRFSLLTAEEILRNIYGDDLKGCKVTLDSIAEIVEAGFKQRAASATDLLDVYAKVVEAMHLLSTPPENAKTLDAEALRSLLSERLDGIRTLAKRTMDTTAMLKPPGSSSD